MASNDEVNDNVEILYTGTFTGSAMFPYGQTSSMQNLVLRDDEYHYFIMDKLIINMTNFDNGIIFEYGYGVNLSMYFYEENYTLGGSIDNQTPPNNLYSIYNEVGIEFSHI